ncbi:F-box protein [Camellia lanceoleosa]|uniref:F-box protein n=1 Tax=Camellia lanceoleosa TaxID=1840588 RepID=A0ACC0HDK6_9ERIC|nr:F-box protein [Camellia lanceoleosa]
MNQCPLPLITMSDYMPNELLIEILARLPVDSLLRFTSVCKSWYSLITSPSFITKNINQTITDRKRNSDKLILRLYTDNDKKEHYLLCPDDENSPDDYLELPFPFKSPNGYFRIFGSCNGLLCLCDDYYDFSHDHFYGSILDASQIVLWNPSIRKSVTIRMLCRPPGCYMFVLGFGAHPTTHEYKVVRLVYLTTYYSHLLPRLSFSRKAQGYGDALILLLLRIVWLNLCGLRLL